MHAVAQSALRSKLSYSHFSEGEWKSARLQLAALCGSHPSCSARGQMTQLTSTAAGHSGALATRPSAAPQVGLQQPALLHSTHTRAAAPAAESVLGARFVRGKHACLLLPPPQGSDLHPPTHPPTHHARTNALTHAHTYTRKATPPAHPQTTLHVGFGSFGCEGCVPDTVNGTKFVRDLYQLAQDTGGEGLAGC